MFDSFNPYTLIKFVHVFGAITAIGTNLTYVLWIRRTANAPEHLPYVLQTIRYLDRRLANPAYVLILLSGLGMVTLVDAWRTTFWVAAGLALYIAAFALGIFGFAPNFRRQIAALERDGAASAEFARFSRRTSRYLALMVGVVVTVVLVMVFKPNPDFWIVLWGG